MQYDEWGIVENHFSTEGNCNNETIFSIGNGYMGMRGSFEEGYSGPEGTGLEGTYINGFYDSEYIKYGEAGYGFAEKSQTMLNVTNSKLIKLYIEDEEFDILKGELKYYNRTLDLKKGILIRNVVWRSPKGKEIKLEAKRLASFDNKHIFAFEYKITPLNFQGCIKILSAIDGNVSNTTAEDDPRVGSGFSGKVLQKVSGKVRQTYGELIQKTKMTNRHVACSMENSLETKCPYITKNLSGESYYGVIFEVEALCEEELVLNKYTAYTTDRDCNREELSELAYALVSEAKSLGFSELEDAQRKFLEAFWYKSDVTIKGDSLLQQGIRFNIFHLLQAAGTDGKTNIPAKGLTGEGYDGHYFWDTETFMLPFFLYSKPEIARKLLEYRYSTLDKARERARIMAHKKGVLFPWRTINGEECSAYFPAGTAQYHINADIALAIKRYMEATEDVDFLIKYGAEIIFETARLWVDAGSYINNKGNRFCINCVTGPDEYTALVNNNFYTNAMAKENLLYSFETALWMCKEQPKAHEELKAKIGLEPCEVDEWKKAADNMYLPYDEDLKIHPQDDSFLQKAVWDFENTPKENYPLLMHYHPLVIYRYQVCKQADVVLALFLLSEKFSKEQKKRDYDYYESITTHDSSLSSCIYCIEAAEIGYYEKAYSYFMKTVRMDLDNHQGNTEYGIHAANMAGAWACVVNGFGGMRVYDGLLHFNPYVPDNWQEYSFNITFKGSTISVKAKNEQTIYKLLEGKPLKIIHNDTEISLSTIGTEQYI